MSQKKRATGWLRELKARGVTFDKRGRARRDGAVISDRALALALTKVRGRSESARGARLTTLDRQLDRWGVAEKQRKKATVARVAKLTGASERKAKEWIKKDGMPRELLDRVAADVSKQRVYPATWKHGTKSKATRAEEAELRKAFKKFVRARERGDPKAFKLYEKWRAIKEYLRKRLTMKEWRRLVSKIGRAEGLQKEGLFSIMRFILS